MTRLPAGRSSTSIPGSSPSSSGSVRRSRPSPPGKRVAATSWKCRSTAVEGLGEPLLDRLGQLPPELLELVEAALEVGPLRDELLQPLLLGLVLLLRERVDLTELLAPPLEPLERARRARRGRLPRPARRPPPRAGAAPRRARHRCVRARRRSPRAARRRRPRARRSSTSSAPSRRSSAPSSGRARSVGLDPCP